MDNIRLFLWFALLGSLWVSYMTWVADREAALPASSAVAPSAAVHSAPPAVEGPPELGPAPSDSAMPAVEVTPKPSARGRSAPTNAIHVRTDVLDLLIDTVGGDIVRTDLPTYPVDKAVPDVPVRLLDYAEDTRWVVQTGFRAADGGSEPDHLAEFRAAASSYQLADGKDELEIELDWVADGIVTASKIYRFRRGSYEIDLDLVLGNGAAGPWRGAAYARMVRLHRPLKRSFLSGIDSYSFTGPVLYDGDRSKKLDFDDITDEPVDQTVENGWLAGIQHHFLAAVVPPVGAPVRYEAGTRGQEYVLTAIGSPTDVAAGGELRFPLKLFIGPKLQDQLAATAQELELTVDYGRLKPLAQPLFWVLSKIEYWVGNWGLAIILCTMLIKLVFYKLTATSGRSMAKMRKLAPRMKALQERFKDDRQALSKAMMDLYKREKVNPAAGCLPILIQMPFFFAFYWVLIESVEMRQAPFFLWINDLSVRDPFFVLPVLMGAAMLFQMRLNPAPPDPMQARIMQIMPIVFTAMFAFFPAGLVLYWLTNTAMSILQQWRINQLVAREG